MSEGPIFVTIPAKTEPHCGKCQFFRVLHTSWCGHPTAKPSMLVRDRYISYEGDDDTPEWCPLLPKELREALCGSIGKFDETPPEVNM